MIYTHNIDETLDFYVNVLGFHVRAYESEWHWATVSKDGIDIMISDPNKEKKEIIFEQTKFTGCFFFYMNGIEEYWKDVKQEEVEIVYPLQVFDYGMKEFCVYDNNGYMLQFGEEAI